MSRLRVPSWLVLTAFGLAVAARATNLSAQPQIPYAPAPQVYYDNQVAPGTFVAPIDGAPLEHLPPDGAAQPAPLPLPGSASPLPRRGGEQADDRALGKPSGWLGMLGSLAFVLGLFFCVAWMFRKAAPAPSQSLPREVVDVLGRVKLPGRQQGHLLRLGNKLLLVAFNPTGADTLTEITDPLEVDRLAGLCQQAQAGSTSDAFRQMLSQFAHDGSSRLAWWRGRGTEPADEPGGRHSQATSDEHLA